MKWPCNISYSYTIHICSILEEMVWWEEFWGQKGSEWAKQKENVIIWGTGSFRNCKILLRLLVYDQNKADAIFKSQF